MAQMHLTVGVFGERLASNELAGKLAKKGTTNDIAIYSIGSSEGVLTYVVPNSESGKIVPILECLGMADVPVLVANALDKEIGELIVAISEAGFERGFILAGPGVEDSMKPFISKTDLKDFTFVPDEQTLRQKIVEFGMSLDRTAKQNGPLMVTVDNSFKVKGVGTIVLGFVASGTVKKHDNVIIEPKGDAASIKGIQSQDNDIDEAGTGMRVGLNLKDIEPEEIKRGDVVCRGGEGLVLKSKDVRLAFQKNPHFKQEIKEGTRVMLSCGLQVESCTVRGISEGSMLLEGSGPVAYVGGQRCIVASQNDILPRIIGHGTVS